MMFTPLSYPLEPASLIARPFETTPHHRAFPHHHKPCLLWFFHYRKLKCSGHTHTTKTSLSPFARLTNPLYWSPLGVRLKVKSCRPPFPSFIGPLALLGEYPPVDLFLLPLIIPSTWRGTFWHQQKPTFLSAPDCLSLFLFSWYLGCGDAPLAWLIRPRHDSKQCLVLFSWPFLFFIHSKEALVPQHLGACLPNFSHLSVSSLPAYHDFKHAGGTLLPFPVRDRFPLCVGSCFCFFARSLAGFGACSFPDTPRSASEEPMRQHYG